MKEKFRLTIIKFLENKLQKTLREEEIDWDGNFIENGYLDSLEIYKLILFLEEELKIQLPISDIIEDFPNSFSKLFNKIHTT